MAKGEKTFNVTDTEKVKRSFEPFAAGDYPCKLLGQTIEVKKGQGSGLPYLNLAFEVIGSGGDGQKDRRVYHMLFCSLKKNDDGKMMVQNADQLKGLVDALKVGDEAKNLKTLTVKDTKGNEVECLAPIALKKWLQAHDGEIVQAHIRIRPARKDPNTGQEYSAQNVIDYFEEAEAGAGESAGGEEEEEESEEGEESEGSEGEVEEDESEEGEEEGEEEEGEEDEEGEDDELEAAVKKKAPAKKVVKAKGKKSKK